MGDGKELVLKEFQKNPQKYWKVDIFEQEGYKRYICKICGKGFWSIKERETCPEHDIYQFINNTPVKNKLDYFQTWEKFAKFFEKNGHEIINRYPVVSTWRPDLFFVIASIQDFQRLEGKVISFEYPANPLVVPQICLRFNDIENVGVTGKHLTCFQMSGQHAFNDGKGGYWKDECMQYNFEFLTKELSINKEEIVYLEDVWTMPDLSAFGPCIEAHVRGLEIVNNVFMEFYMDNGQIKQLPTRVVDVGWGHERLVWFSQGTYTLYDAVFKPIIDKLLRQTGISYDKEIFEKYSKLAATLNFEDVDDVEKAKEEVARKIGISKEELEKNVEPMHAIYAIVDHTRSLTFGISDGALPSNVGGGYNLRVLLRRALSFVEKLNLNINPIDVCFMHVDYFGKMFPEIRENTDAIQTILEHEIKKWKEGKKQKAKIIEKLKNKSLSLEELLKVYESQGITPEELGIKVPREFYKKLTEKRSGRRIHEEKINFDVSHLPATQILYYNEPEIFEFEAEVIESFDDWVVLDKTAFFPTSGGQMHDTGKLNESNVIEVIKVGKVILHKVDKPLKKGEKVIGRVDRERRYLTMLHHDAIHIINGAVKKVIGKWCNQYGSQVEHNKARIDITHFKRLEKEEVEKIEKLANEVVKNAISIEKEILPRQEAERKYGFWIYQGGYVPEKNIRIVKIGNFDVEACGEKKKKNTKDVGCILITRTKRIADGLVRIEIKANKAAIEFLEEKKRILEKVAETLNVREEEVPEKVMEVFNEWKKLKKKK